MNYFITFLAALVITYLGTPLAERVALRYGVIDRPKSRKVHTVPIPTCGGVIIYLAVWIGLLLTGKPSHSLIGIWIGSTLMMLLGILDDVWDLRPMIKLGGQILAAFTVLHFGVGIGFFRNPIEAGYIYLNDWQTALVTILWIVGITNTINLIDGLDGLAAGVTAISSVTLFIMTTQMPSQATLVTAGLMSIGTCGASLGFLRHNFSPARIFMGDAGSQFLGFMLACIALVGAFKSAATVAIVVPVLVLGLPVFDTFFAILRRFIDRRPIFSADRGHLHHRLLDRGLSQCRVVLILYLVTAVLCATALMVSRMG